MGPSQIIPAEALSTRRNTCPSRERTRRTLLLDVDHHVHFSTHASLQICCEEGLLWLTCSDQLHDWVLREGEALELPAGRWLIGALRPSVIRFEPRFDPAPQMHSRWHALLTQFARRLLRIPPALALRF